LSWLIIFIKNPALKNSAALQANCPVIWRQHTFVFVIFSVIRNLPNPWQGLSLKGNSLSAYQKITYVDNQESFEFKDNISLV